MPAAVAKEDQCHQRRSQQDGQSDPERGGDKHVNVKLGLAARHERYRKRGDDDRECRRHAHDAHEALPDRAWRGWGWVGNGHVLSFGRGS